MSKKLLLAVAVSALIAAPSYAGVFADVPFDHWAYGAVEDLAQAGVLEGYPDGTYKGHCAMTRYEFAVAVERAYKWIQKTLGGMTRADLEKLLADPAFREKLRGPAGKDGAAGRDGQSGTVGRDGKDGRDGANGRDGKDGQNGTNGKDGKIPTDWLTRLEDVVKKVDRLAAEFRPELEALKNDVNAMKAKLAALESSLTALQSRVQDLDNRVSALERFKWFGRVRAGIGVDGTNAKGGNVPPAAAAQNGGLDFSVGEGVSYLSLQAGVDVNLGGEMRGRFSWWYDTDGNQHHGAGAGGLGALGVDEAWVRTPALGGKWIFGRQYAGQDYETGAANPSLGLGTGYYTGAALTGIRAQYGLGSFGKLTVLTQADDANLAGGKIIGNAGHAVGNGTNIAALARLDVPLNFWKNSKGQPKVKIGFQTVGHMPSKNPTAAGLVKGFNDGTSSHEFSVSADVWVDVLQGLHVEYTRVFRGVQDGKPLFNGPGYGPGAGGTSKAQAVYGTLGVLKTRTVKLDVAAGVADRDFRLSHSILTNPYVPSTGVFSLFDRPVIIDSLGWNAGVISGPSQGFDANLSWMIGSRPLQIRWAGSFRKADPFNWMVHAAFPLVMTPKGNVTLDGGYVDVDGGHGLAKTAGGRTGVVGVRLMGGFSF